MTTRMTPFLLGLAAVVAAVGVKAQSPPAAPPSPVPAASAAAPPPCTAPEYRQFDFWVGHWDVKDPSGQVIGTNRITREYGGCVLQEHWEAKGPIAQTGSSFNTYFAAGRHWHQTWVDSTGGFLLLDGGLVEGSMVLAAEMPARTGKGTMRHKITFTPRPDGTVRQYWEVSRDGGQTWTANFDGVYVRKAE